MAQYCRTADYCNFFVSQLPCSFNLEDSVAAFIL